MYSFDFWQIMEGFECMRSVCVLLTKSDWANSNMLNVYCPADWRPEEWQRTAQSSTTTAWPGNQWNYITVTKKTQLPRINSLKWRNNPSMTHLLTPLHRLKMFFNSSSVWMLVWYTRQHSILNRDSLTVVKIRSAVKAHFVFFLHSRENSATLTDPYGITLFFQKYPACHRSLSFSLNLGIVNQ